jgi:hypothetical protein
MTTTAERALRRHIREKATIDHLVRKPRRRAGGEEPEQSSRTSTGLSIERQIRKKWGPDKGGLPTFWPPAFLVGGRGIR